MKVSKLYRHSKEQMSNNPESEKMAIFSKKLKEKLMYDEMLQKKSVSKQ